MNEKLMDEKSGKLVEKKSSPEKQEKHSKKSVKDDNNLIVSSTAEIPVSKNLIDQVVGQSQAVEIIKKAAAQKRNVLLVGVPGTGKSMLAQAMSEILPIGELKDILIYPNSQDQNNPRVVTVKAGEGKKIVQQSRLDAKSQEDSTRLITFLLPLVWFIINYVIWTLGFISDVIYAATLILGGFVMVGVILGTQVKMTSSKQTPKLLIDNAGKKVAPFAEATGARAGSLLGDVRHDPLQSFIDESNFAVFLDNEWKKFSFEELWNLMSERHPDLIEKHEKGYESIYFPDEEKIYTYGSDEKGNVVRTRIYLINRRPYKDKVIKIKTKDASITLTPEHEVFTEFESKKVLDISNKDKALSLKIKHGQNDSEELKLQKKKLPQDIQTVSSSF